MSKQRTAALKELASLKQWVAHTSEKIPINPETGRRASSTNPETWGRLSEAFAIMKIQGLPGVGFVFSEDDPYVGIDLDNAIDIYIDENCVEHHRLRDWASDIVQRLNSYTEVSPGGMGLHIWVKGELPRQGLQSLGEDGGVEIYQSRRYFTVTGRHLPGTPEAIKERGAELQEVLEDYFDVYEEPLDDDQVKADPDFDDDIEVWLEDALSYIDPNCGYAMWIRVGMAIHSAMPVRGVDYWDKWSRKSDAKYPGTETIRKKWASFEGSGVGVGSIVHHARQAGWAGPDRMASMPDSFQHGWDVFLDSKEDDDALGDSEAGKGLEVEIFEAVQMYRDKTEPEPYLIEPGVLSPGDMALIFGPPKSMKTFACLDMFRQFAMGKEWLGLRPGPGADGEPRKLKTLIAQFEVRADRMRERLQLATLSEDELEAMEGNLYITERFTPRLTPSYIEKFSKIVLENITDLDVLVIDPMANIFPGDNENDNAQMSAFIRQLKYLRNEISPSVAIVLVHHANKMRKEDRRADPFNSLRGASALRGAYDAGMMLDKDHDDATKVHMWFELRNGDPIDKKTLHFHGGRFHEVLEGVEEPAEEVEHVSLPTRICNRLDIDAERGIIWQKTEFCEHYGGKMEMPGITALKEAVNEMLELGILGYWKQAGELEVPELHHRSKGYLGFETMSVRIGRGFDDVEILP